MCSATVTRSALMCMESPIRTRRRISPTAGRPRCAGAAMRLRRITGSSQTYNAANDYYFEDYGAARFQQWRDASSTQFIKDVKSAGSHSADDDGDAAVGGAEGGDLIRREAKTTITGVFPSRSMGRSARRSLQHRCRGWLEDRLQHDADGQSEDAACPLLDQPGTQRSAEQRVSQSVGGGSGCGFRHRSSFLRHG